MSVYGNVNGFAIMGDNRLVDVDALESQLAEKDKEIETLRAILSKNDPVMLEAIAMDDEERARLRAEIERMRPVVEAAQAYAHAPFGHVHEAVGIGIAVIEYERSKPNLPSGTNESPASGGNVSGES